MATINPDTAGAPTGEVYVDSLIWGGSWAPVLGQGASLSWATVGIADAGAARPTTGLAWSEDATAALRLALSLWAEVADLTFTEAAPDSGGTDLSYLLVGARTMRQLTQTQGALGFHGVPDGTDAAPLTGVFNVDGRGWTEAGLARGGYGFVTLVHEIGHGLGLAHPHDGGGDGQVFPGVGNSGDTGLHQLNQGIFTVMSYVDGWRTEFPTHADDGYGWQAGPMALDIAAVQAIYGANSGWRTGDDAYALPVENGPGTYWSCIWDAAGADAISAAGATGDAVIDLRAATLAGRHAGGFVSHVAGIVGGVTIAHDVVIEAGIGGAGNDSITGNAAANRLEGGGGEDRISGGLGNDTLVGGAGADVLTGGAGHDSFVFVDAPGDRGAADRIADFQPGLDRILLDHEAFAGIGAPGPLAATLFAAGRRAAEADDRVVYDAGTGQLRWDQDGQGGAAAVIFALLGAGVALTAGDIWVV